MQQIAWKSCDSHLIYCNDFKIYLRSHRVCRCLLLMCMHAMHLMSFNAFKWFWSSFLSYFLFFTLHFFTSHIHQIFLSFFRLFFSSLSFFFYFLVFTRMHTHFLLHRPCIECILWCAPGPATRNLKLLLHSQNWCWIILSECCHEMSTTCLNWTVEYNMLWKCSHHLCILWTLRYRSVQEQEPEQKKKKEK